MPWEIWEPSAINPKNFYIWKFEDKETAERLLVNYEEGSFLKESA